MTNEEYIGNMNELGASISVVHASTTNITDEDLDAMEKMVDGAGMRLLWNPLVFEKVHHTPDQQRAVLKLHRDIRAFVASFEKGDRE